MLQHRQSGFTLLEVLVVLVVVATLAALLIPVYGRSREQARLATCASNLRQIYIALKMYEGDYAELPVHSSKALSQHWRARIAPYIRSSQVFLCPSDKDRGEPNRWGWTSPCSYAYAYTSVNLWPGKKYRQPVAVSPLLICMSHRGYQCVMCRYDGAIEMPPPFRYPMIKITFEE